MIRLRLAAAARARRVVHGGDEQDAGFMLVYVLMVITIITVLVGTTLVVTSSAVVPAQQAAYDQAADSAALGGLQSFLAYADSACSGQNSAVATCTLPQTGSGDVTISTGGAYTATYNWSASKVGGYFRVSSLGTIRLGGVAAKRLLVADVAGGVSSNPLSSNYITQFETQAPDVAQALFPPRTIGLNAAAISAAGIPNTGSAVTWTGAQSGAAAGDVNVCNSLYGGSTGRVNNPPPNAPSPYVDWSETGTLGTASYTDFQPCQVSLGHSTQFLGPGGGLVSRDALLISNSYPGATGPVFDVPVSTGYQYDPATDGVCGATGQNYRTFNLICAGYPVDIGGTPSGAYTPTFVSNLPPWPTNTPTVSPTACQYVGPTRIVLKNDGSAVVTSPLTTTAQGSSSLSCYGGSTPTSAGLYGVTVANFASVTNGVVSVKNKGTAPTTTPTLHTNTGWGTVNTRSSITASNSVFYDSVPATGPTVSKSYVTTANDKPYTPSVGDNPSTQADGAWTPQWTSDTSGTTCGAGNPALTDLRLYRCYAASGSYDATAYVDLKNAIKTALSTSPSSYASAATFNSLVSSKVSAANSSDAANASPTFADYRSHRWQVSTATDGTATDGCTPSTGSPSTVTTPNAVTTPLSTDGLFQSSNGSQSTTSETDVACYTATVTLQVGTCSVALVGSLCLGSFVWGNGTALLGGGARINQFKVTETVGTTTTTTSTTQATSSFPVNGDVTPYGMATDANDAPGDLYVEGSTPSSLALVAQDDVVITNSLSASNPPSNAVEVVAQNNVRVYHPVGCTSTDGGLLAATTAGFCPNDVTGLYSGVLATAARPDQQYANLAADQKNGAPLTDLAIHAAVFALGNASTNCPEPTGGGGFCGGEFTTDNYNRGDGLGTLTVTGGVYMAHHGPVGQEWEVSDTSGQTSRPYSGYHLTLQYQDLTAAITAITANAVVPLTEVSSSVWRIVSISQGTAS